MTHVWPVFGEAPVPSFVSSYWRPEGVVFICDSFFPAATAGVAGAGFSSARAGSAREATKEHARRIFEIRIELSLPFMGLSGRRSLPRRHGSHAGLEPFHVALRTQVDRCPVVVRGGTNLEDAPPAVAGCAPRRLGDERERGRFVHQADLAFGALSRGRVEIDPAFEDDAVEVRDERSGVARRVGTPRSGVVWRTHSRNRRGPRSQSRTVPSFAP